MKKFKETIRLKIRRFYIKKTAKKRQNKLKNTDFTIISNNCWAGFVYQSYALKYRTPTIGLFFMAEDYIKFIKDLKKYVNMKLEFIEPINSKWYEKLKNKSNFNTYPIGRLDDIEIHFLHYKTELEASEKWNERKKRINWDNILYKFSEMNECRKDDIEAFQRLELKNKICFVSEKYKDLSNSYTFVLKGQKERVNASYEPFGKNRYFDLTQYVNNMLGE